MRGPEKVWVYGAPRVGDAQALTLAHRSRNTEGYLRLLKAIERANPSGELYLITDDLSSHKSPPIRKWLEEHPRVKQIFIPLGAWWRLFRREALAGQTFANGEEIEKAARVATQQLNSGAKPWV